MVVIVNLKPTGTVLTGTRSRRTAVRLKTDVVEVVVAQYKTSTVIGLNLTVGARTGVRDGIVLDKDKLARSGNLVVFPGAVVAVVASIDDYYLRSATAAGEGVMVYQTASVSNCSDFRITILEGVVVNATSRRGLSQSPNNHLSVVVAGSSVEGEVFDFQRRCWDCCHIEIGRVGRKRDDAAIPVQRYALAEFHLSTPRRAATAARATNCVAITRSADLRVEVGRRARGGRVGSCPSVRKNAGTKPGK